MVHSNRGCIQAGTQVLVRVASGRHRVNELTHFPPSNRAEISPMAQTRPHRSWQGRGKARQAPGGRSQSCLITKPSLFTHQERQRKANKGDGSAASAERPLIRPGVPGGARLFSGLLSLQPPPGTSSGHPCQGTPAVPIPERPSVLAMSIPRRCWQPAPPRSRARSRAISSPSHPQEPPWQWFQTRLPCL